MAVFPHSHVAQRESSVTTFIVQKFWALIPKVQIQVLTPGLLGCWLTIECIISTGARDALAVRAIGTHCIVTEGPQCTATLGVGQVNKSL